MAILWPTVAGDQTRRDEDLRRALGQVVVLAEAGASVLAIRGDDPERARPDGASAAAPEAHIVCWNIARDAAHRLVELLAADPAPEPLDGRPRSTILPEMWGGDVASMTLGDAAATVGELHLLGAAGLATRRPLADPTRRQALAGLLVTAIRQRQEIARLQQENRQLGSILHFSGDGIITVDATLRITGFNPAMQVMTAWHEREVLGRFYYDVLRPRSPQGTPLGYARDPLVQAIETGRTVLDRGLILLTRDGQQVDVSVTAAAVRSPLGQPISGVLNVRDITRSREAEELRTTFISVISHELQTPIAIIKGYASTLAREDAHWDVATLRDRLRAIEEESDRLSHLVGNLLYASRIQAGGLTMERAELDLAEMTRAVVRRFAARSPNLDLRVRFPAHCPLVLADRERIEEVLMNLLDNAVKYSPRGQRIRVRGQVSDDEVIVHVIDAGAGIPLRERARIFERFQRVENTAARRTQGAGLGLYICRAIVEAHGGHIWVRSTLGRGSIFSFALPREERASLPMVLFGSLDQHRPGDVGVAAPERARETV